MPDQTRFSLRLPHDLHTLLIERAAAERRSLNAQMITAPSAAPMPVR